MPRPNKAKLTPKPKTAAAKKERERFMAAFENQVVKAKKTVALSILVWGPGNESKSPVGPKRREIYEVLMDLGHNAMASEDLTAEKFTKGLSEASKEFAQVREADLVIILIEDAPGALAETHDFASDPEVAQKFLVFVPKKYEKGYSGKGVIADLDKGWRGVYWYEDDEVPACHLLTESVDCAEARRQVEYRRRRKHG